jgi:hypothetical protein
MPPRQDNVCGQRPAGHLLLLGCSGRKRATKGKLPALELYDGVNFRVLRTFLNERGWPPGLCIKILSAKHGFIDAADLIEFYDQRLDESTAKKWNRRVLSPDYSSSPFPLDLARARGGSTQDLARIRPDE